MADADSTQLNSGMHILDVAASFNSCCDAFGQLAALLNIIKKELPEHTDIRKLAELAHYTANDYGNVADCLREDILTDGVKGYVNGEAVLVLVNDKGVSNHG